MHGGALECSVWEYTLSLLTGHFCGAEKARSPPEHGLGSTATFRSHLCWHWPLPHSLSPTSHAPALFLDPKLYLHLSSLSDPLLRAPGATSDLGHLVTIYC